MPPNNQHIWTRFSAFVVFKINFTIAHLKKYVDLQLQPNDYLPVPYLPICNDATTA